MVTSIRSLSVRRCDALSGLGVHSIGQVRGRQLAVTSTTAGVTQTKLADTVNALRESGSAYWRANTARTVMTLSSDAIPSGL